MDYSLSQEQLEFIEEVLEKDLMTLGLDSVILIDLAGNILTSYESSEVSFDLYSLAALAAGNFGAVSTMASMIGENEFSLLFNKGERENLHFSKIFQDFLLITVFGHDTSLGSVRMKIAEVTRKLEDVLG
jgi:predicted regulator of Ras-like GTPase activity (Roadblock/LC7/MglB family)